MNDDQIDDLKQFISATISQQTAHLATKDDIAKLEGDITRLEGDIGKLDQKVDAIQAAIGEAMSESTEATDTQLADHEQRITKLEHHLA